MMFKNSKRLFFLGNQQQHPQKKHTTAASSHYPWPTLLSSRSFGNKKKYQQQEEQVLDREEVQRLKAIANTLEDEILEVRKLNFISDTLRKVYSASSLGQNAFSSNSFDDSFDKRQDDRFNDSFFNECHHEEKEDDTIQRICLEATMACLWNIIEHLFDFLEQNNCNEHTNDAYDKSICRCSHPQYKDWIRELHPENVNGKVVDHRFYVQESDHRMVWNEHMKMNDRMDLVIQPRFSGVYVNAMSQ